MKIYFDKKLQVNAEVGEYTIRTDQPVKAGSLGEYPAPFTLFLASIGTCAGIYVKGFCDQRKISTDNIWLTQDNHYDPSRRVMGKIVIIIHVPEDFPEKYESAVIASAQHCAVKKHLRDDIDLIVKIQKK
ncbi:MAG: OsmC family protein [Bacteroidales bacterium]|nr:OsmC family protein [Bacteroidales bacterium]